jgi:cell division protein FtsW (lipid II flippase)
MPTLAAFWPLTLRSFEILAVILASLALAITGLRSLKSASTHEDLSRNHRIQGPSDRSFGFVMAAFFVLLGLAPLRHHLPVRIWSLALALVFLVFALLRPAVLAPLNKAWMALGLLLSRVVTPVVIGLMFYLVFTPVGFLYRLLGRDPLHLKFSNGTSSYWIKRDPPGPLSEEMVNQF